MPEASKSVVRARTESHSDVSNTPAARQYQQKLTEQQFSDALLRRLRDAKAPIHLAEFKDEWTSSNNGMVHELSVNVEEDASAG